VHVALIRADVTFGRCDHLATAPFGRIMYEISNPNYAQVAAAGLFVFDFNAILQGPDPDASWCGHFLLEVLCFG
jgi:hypothetical protein